MHLASVTIGNSVTSIGNLAFDGCFELEALSIPSSVTSIGEDTFLHCHGITSIGVDEDNPCYCSQDNVLFNKDKTKLLLCAARKTGDYTIPNTVKEFGVRAFENCLDLNAVVLPTSVTSIEWGAFRRCQSLTSVTIPSSVTIIGDLAFSSCLQLTTVSISSSVKKIGDEAFQGCQCLTDIYCYATELPQTGLNVFQYVDKRGCTLHVPSRYWGKYNSTNPWSEFLNIEPIEEVVGIDAAPQSDEQCHPVLSINDRQLSISAINVGEKITLYSINGKLIETLTADANSLTIDLPGCDIWLLRIGQRVYKIRS